MHAAQENGRYKKDMLFDMTGDRTLLNRSSVIGGADVANEEKRLKDCTKLSFAKGAR